MLFPKTNDMTLREAALAYAGAGFKVFPIVPGDKVPFKGSRGCKDATNKTEKVLEWWTRYPTANIGLATGPDSGVLAIDLDEKNEKHGIESFQMLERDLGALPLHSIAVTPSESGQHRFFAYPSEGEIRSTSEEFARGVDVRGIGGYVVVSPSTVGGKKYQWMKIHPLSRLPLSWEHLLTTREKKTRVAHSEFDPDADDRNVHLYAYGVYLLSRGMKPDILETELARCNTLFKKGPLDQSEFQKVYRSILNNEKASERGEIVTELIVRYVWVYGTKSFYDLKTGEELDQEQLNGVWSHRFVKGTASQVILKHPDRRVARYTTLAPGGPQFVKDSESIVHLNVYGGSPVSPIAGDASPFVGHLEYVFGEDVEEREHFINWMAWQVQHPGKKIQHAVLLQGYPGLGKTFFGKVLRDLIGPRYVVTIKNQDLRGRFNGWIENKLLIMVEEVSGIDRKILNDFKALITDKRVLIERKGMDTYESRNLANFFMTTNHRDAIQGILDDRRIWVYMSQSRAKSQSYYIELMGWVERNHGVILQYLLDRATPTGFGSMHAPVNKSKRVMDMAALGDAESIIADAWLSGQGPFSNDLFAAHSIRKWLDEHRYKEALTMNQLGELLKRLGAVQLKRVKTSGRHGTWGPHVWCRPEHAERYKDMSPRELHAAWTGDSEPEQTDLV